jgi:hypothetical protein
MFVVRITIKIMVWVRARVWASAKAPDKVVLGLYLG